MADWPNYTPTRPLGDGRLYDVVAITIRSPHTKRLIAERKTAREADAIERMAIMRRGVDVEFYKVVPHPADLSPGGKNAAG